MRSLKWLTPLAQVLWVVLQVLLVELSMYVMWATFGHDLKRILWSYSFAFGVAIIWAVGFLYCTRIRDE